MKLILEIVSLLDHYKASQDGNSLPNGKIKDLYEAVVKGKVKNDQEAANYLYREAAKSKKFLMLKGKLKDHLVDRLLQVSNFDSKSDIAVKSSCYKQLVLSELFLQHKLYAYAEKLLVKTEKQARVSGLVYIQEESLVKLRSILISKGEVFKLVEHRERVNKLREIRAVVDKARELSEILQFQSSFTIAKSKSLEQQAREYSQVVGNLLDQYDHPNLQYFYYKIQSIEYTNAQDEIAFKDILQKKVAMAKRYSFLRNSDYLVEVNLNRVYLCYVKGSYRSALRYLEKSLQYTNISWNQLVALQDELFDTYMKLGEYGRAGELLCEIRKQENVAILTLFDQNRWYLKQAYLFYMLLCQNQANQIEQFTPDFIGGVNFSVFDKKVSLLYKDKAGYCVQVLIIKTLLTYETKSKETSHLTGSLRAYFRRHLKEAVEQKTKVFFEMLIVLAACNFNKKKIKQKGDAFLERLHAGRGSFYEKQELINYETLWKTVLSRLK